MSAVLDEPRGSPSNWALAIWKYRAEEVPGHRPITTGDVFKGVIPVPRKAASNDDRLYVVLQHPCTIRRDGLNIRDGVLVAVVKRGSSGLESWPRDKTYNKMPLPELIPRTELVAISTPPEGKAASVECWWAEFETLAIVNSDHLASEKRLAVMDLEGVALLFQRFTHYLTRACPLKTDFETAIHGADTEVEILEEWIGCAIENNCPPENAAKECVEWLGEEQSGSTRKALLDESLARGRIVREAVAESKRRYGTGSSQLTFAEDLT